MYANDASLPVLPLPTLEATARGLHRSALAFQEDNNDNKGSSQPPPLPSADALASQAASALADAQAVLQHRHETKNNWMGEWWDAFAYLRARYPVAINSNIMAARLVEMDPITWRARPLVNDPALRAALCIRESLHFRQRMMRGCVEEVIRFPKPVCMQQFRRYYGMRIPKRDMDVVVYPESPGDTEFAVIMYKGQISFVRVAERGQEAPLLSVAELALVIRTAIDSMGQWLSNNNGGNGADAAHSIGLLTCANRDAAADGLQALRSASVDNARYLDTLYFKTLTSVSIDDTPVHNVNDALRLSAVGQCHNRWYDRATSQIVAANGVSMYQGEHSPMDAIVCATTPIEVVTHFCTKLLSEIKAAEGSPDRHPEQRVRAGFQPNAHVEHAVWTIPLECRSVLIEAKQQHDATAETCEFHALRFLTFGRRFLSQRRVSADFVMQLALQWAHVVDAAGSGCGGKCFAATYESASTRFFREGRTETIRSLTVEMRTLINLLMAAATTSASAGGRDGGVPRVDAASSAGPIKAAFLAAQARHLRLAMEASTGAGIDRHLLGLKIAQGAAVQKPWPDVMEHPSIQAAQNYTLLTSQMVGETYLGGFSHTLPSGYGVCYYTLKSEIRACISANAVAGKTNAVRFSNHVERNLSMLGEFVHTHFDEKPSQQGKANDIERRRRSGSAPPPSSTRASSRL